MGKKSKQNEKEQFEMLKRNDKTDVHTKPLPDLLADLGTSRTDGLTKEEAAMRHTRDGDNAITPTKQKPLIVRFLMSFVNGFSMLLFAGGILCFIAYIISYTQDPNAAMDNLYLGVVLIAVVIITGVFSFYQENKSSKIMDTFKTMIPYDSLVLRSGVQISIPVKEIVVGDIVFLKSGDYIPADIVVIESKGFKVDNSSITGESEPQKRYPECTHENSSESANFLIAYTYAVEGTAVGVVTAIGDNTTMGRIAKLTAGLVQGKTPIAIETDRFIKIISCIAFVIGIVFFILALTVGGLDFIGAVVFFIGIIVANVPEGLLLTVTVSLTLTAKKMAQKKCLVKNLESVETLGSTSVICSDKTGTLTQNNMLVAHYYCNKSIMEVSTNEDNERQHNPNHPSESYQALVRIAALCNRTDFMAEQAPDVTVSRMTTNGDASETALIKFVEIFYDHVTEVRKRAPKLFEIPFNSTNKYQLSIHVLENCDRYLMVMKGAPERILDRCTKILFDNEGEVEMTEEYKKMVADGNEELAEMGERVLGFAHYWLDKDEFPVKIKAEDMDHEKLAAFDTSVFVDENDQVKFDLTQLTFVGLFSLIDPPRKNVPDAVLDCRSAGIRVIMVTGDHPITAKSIAKNVNIIQGKTVQEIAKERGVPISQVDPLEANAIVVTGAELAEMTNEQLDSVINTYKDIVFARTSPQQKLLIVEGFQRQGAIVAVTGDGVNDSPALRKADIGVAMGIAGTAVAKEAANMVLLDDNFASIVTGVCEGRLIFDNLKKSIAYTLTSNIPEIVPFLVHIIAGIPLPLGTVTILMIDLGTDMVPAISLAYETAETDIMMRMPRNPKKDRLVNQVLINYSYLLVGVWQALNGMLTYLFIMMLHGFLYNELVVGATWDNRLVPYITDSFGQQWSYVARKDLEFTCHSGYFFATVIIQIADLLISKTRKVSIFTQGLLNNKTLLFGILFEVVLAIILIYPPPFHVGLSTRTVMPLYLVPAVINMVLLWVVDEGRRWYMRAHPGGFVERETYY